jgi:hypothetical protein
MKNDRINQYRLVISILEIFFLFIYAEILGIFPKIIKKYRKKCEDTGKLTILPMFKVFPKYIAVKKFGNWRIFPRNGDFFEGIRDTLIKMGIVCRVCLTIKNKEEIHMKRILLSLIVLLSLLSVMSCDNDWQVDIYVPYFESTTDFSPAHCVAMWSAKDGRWESEETIANSISCLSSLDCLMTTETAIWNYTNSQAWITDRPNSDGGQNEALATVRAALKGDSPGIVPFLRDEHFLCNGARGHLDDGRKIADAMRFHVLSRSNWWHSVSEIKLWFLPIHNKYLVIVGAPGFESIGLSDYQQFVADGGTYSGAPGNYVPGTSASGM